MGDGKSSNFGGPPYLKLPRGTDGRPRINDIIGETFMKATEYSLSRSLYKGVARVWMCTLHRSNARVQMCAILKRRTCQSTPPRMMSKGSIYSFIHCRESIPLGTDSGSDIRCSYTIHGVGGIAQRKQLTNHNIAEAELAHTGFR